jgi:hypothetical protein
MLLKGYARSSGKPGVLLVTSGPGATNAVTALTDALYGLNSSGLYFWSSPNTFDWYLMHFKSVTQQE